jgi:glycosyltransferase involved in cell wall biosynthesis
MKIVQLIMARQFRGAEIFANQLASKLREQGHDVLLVSLFTYKTQKFIPKSVAWIDLNGTRSAGFSFSLLMRLKEVILDFRPDIIQANAGDTLKYSAMLKFILPLEFKLVFRNASTISQYIKTPFRKWLLGWLLKKSDFVISVSQLSRHDILSLYGFLNNKITVIPAGVEIQSTINRDSSNTMPSLFDRRPVFIHVGGFTFEKNHIGLLSIFLAYLKSEGKGSILLVGDGPLKGMIEQEVKEKDLQHYVQFLGNRNDVAELLSQSDVLLLPSLIEGLPAIILEAFVNKLPVIAYDVGGIGEVITTGVTGWLIEKNKEDDFLNALRDVVNNPGKVAAITERAFEMAVANFDNKKIAKLFIETYGVLVKGNE